MDSVVINVTPRIIQVALTVTTGTKGDKGDKGDPGAKGDKGDTGAAGAQGIQGIPGAKGDKGDTGAAGAQGIQGIQGDKGDKGDTGAAGSDATVNAANIGAVINGSAADAIGDADTIPFYRSVSFPLLKITWSNIKAMLKAYLDTLYEPARPITQRSLSIIPAAGTYFDASPNITAKVAKTAITNNIRLTPLTVAIDTPVDRIGVNVSTAKLSGGVNGIIGLYASGANGLPAGSPLISIPLTGFDTIAVIEAACTYTLKAGVQYWTALMTDNNAQISAYSTMFSMGMTANNALTYYSCLNKAVTYADGLPNNIENVVTAADRYNAAGGFAVFFRKAV